MAHHLQYQLREERRSAHPERSRHTNPQGRASSSAHQGEWVRRAIERALAEDRGGGDALDRLSRLGAPTADIDQMLAEIDRVPSVSRVTLG